jgi:hypothetical protein
LEQVALEIQPQELLGLAQTAATLYLARLHLMAAAAVVETALAYQVVLVVAVLVLLLAVMEIRHQFLHRREIMVALVLQLLPVFF